MKSRRSILAALAAAPIAVAAPAAARPVVTVWHQLHHRATRLARLRTAFSQAGYVPDNRTLARDLRHLTNLVADMTEALLEEHTTQEPR